MPLYDPNIPQPTDLLNASQADILNNFTTANTSFGINHYPFDNGTSSNGKHKFVQMPEEAAAPVTLSNEAALYTKVATTPAETNLFYRGESNGFEYQLTKTISASTGSFAGANGWTFLPGGLLLQWGTQGGSSSSSVAVVFPVTFSSAAYSVQVTPIRAASSPGSDFSTVVVTGTTSTTGFTIGNIGSHTMAGWFWMAIGIKV